MNDGEGQVLLTYKRLLAEKGNKRLEEAYNNKEVLTAKVVNVLDGGLSVVVEEARVFIPASLVSDTYEKNLGNCLLYTSAASEGVPADQLVGRSIRRKASPNRWKNV